MSKAEAQPSGQEAIKLLSERERQILEMAAGGMLDKQIGQELGLSLNTLRTYWSRIRGKIGDAPRPALAAALVAHDLNDSTEAVPPDHEGWVLDAETMTVDASDGINAIHGLPAGEPHPLSEYEKIFHPEDAPAIRSTLDQLIKGELESAHMVYRLVCNSGVILVNLVARRVASPSGKTARIYGYHTTSLDCRPDTDATVRIGSWVREIPSNEVTADDELREIFEIGLDEPDVMEAVYSRIHPEDRAEVMAAVPRAVRAGQEWVQHHARVVLPSGKTFWARANVYLMDLGGGRFRAVGTVAAFV